MNKIKRANQKRLHLPGCNFTLYNCRASKDMVLFLYTAICATSHASPSFPFCYSYHVVTVRSGYFLIWHKTHKTEGEEGTASMTPDKPLIPLILKLNVDCGKVRTNTYSRSEIKMELCYRCHVEEFSYFHSGFLNEKNFKTYMCLQGSNLGMGFTDKSRLCSQRDCWTASSLL